MATLGINLEKTGFRYCVLEGDSINPNIINFEKISTNNFTNTPLLMNWMKQHFKTSLSDFLLKK